MSRAERTVRHLLPVALVAVGAGALAVLADGSAGELALAVAGAAAVLSMILRARFDEPRWPTTRVLTLCGAAGLVGALVTTRPAAVDGGRAATLLVLAFVNFVLVALVVELLHGARPARARDRVVDSLIVGVSLAPIWLLVYADCAAAIDAGRIAAGDPVQVVFDLSTVLLSVAVLYGVGVAPRGSALRSWFGAALMTVACVNVVSSAVGWPPGWTVQVAWLAVLWTLAVSSGDLGRDRSLASAARRHGPHASQLSTVPTLVAVVPAIAVVVTELDPSTRELIRIAALCSVAVAALLAIRVAGHAREAEASGRAHGMQRFAALVRNSQDTIFVVDASGVVMYVSPSVRMLLGVDPGAVVARPLVELFPEPERARIGEHLVRAVAGPPNGRVELDGPYVDRHGVPGDFEMVVVNLLDDPEVSGCLVTVRSVTERRALERQLARKALFDELTGLANRALFHDRMHHALDRLKRSNGRVGVMLLDLDDFKAVNDGLGHGAGDALLVAVGERLRACMRPSDTIARLGGDEFAVLLEDLESDEAAVTMAERLLESLQLPVTIDDMAVNVPASIGIASTDGGSSPESLMRDADIALYRAKGLGKARVACFTPIMRWEAYEQLRLRTELSRAVAEGNLRLLFQPIVVIGTEEIRGAEALLRWDHPTLGLVPPEEFIPLAEETGLIVPIGAWVLETACAAAVRWNATTGRDAYVSVNVAARQLRDKTFPADLARVLATTGLRSELLMLELTESALIDEVASAVLADDVVPLGVALAIDDFGTGYSSLSYLPRLPVDVVKIDRAFVADMDSKGAQAVVESITAIARAMGFSSIAEGIEQPEQLAKLEAFDCRLGQGYHFSEPVDEETFTRLLRAGAGWLQETREGSAVTRNG